MNPTTQVGKSIELEDTLYDLSRPIKARILRNLARNLAFDFQEEDKEDGAEHKLAVGISLAAESLWTLIDP